MNTSLHFHSNCHFNFRSNSHTQTPSSTPSVQKSRVQTSTHSLTQGNLSCQFLHLSLPLIFGNILQQFYNTIDAFVVGYFSGTDEFAAIGIAGTVMNLFLFMIIGACTGLSVLFARYYGLKDMRLLHRQHFTALILGLGFSVLLGLSGFLTMQKVLLLLHTPDSLIFYTRCYLVWIFLSLPAAFLYNMYASALRASGDTFAALCILAASIFSNLLLDLLFVACFHDGIAGAAKATALTQCFAAVLCILYLLRSHREFLFQKKDCILNLSMISTTLKCSLVTSLHQASLYIGKALVQGTVNTGGTELISAYTAATRIEGFANSFGDSTSAATSILTSQNYGAGNRDRVKQTFRHSLRSTLFLGILSGILLALTAHLSIRLMIGTSQEMAFSGAVHYLRLIAWFYPLCFIGGTFTGHFNGLGKMLFTLCGTLFQIILRVILSALFFPAMQLNAVALATGLGWFFAVSFWTICYLIRRHLLKPTQI